MVAKYAADADLLEEVRIYWDQATLLKQLGIFQMAFHTCIKKNEADFANGLATLPIMDGMRSSRRLAHPTPHNCNQLAALEALEAARQGRMMNSTAAVKLSPSTSLAPSSLSSNTW